MPVKGPGPEAEEPRVPGAGPGAPPGGPGPPAAPPKRADLLRVVDRVQKKDTMNIFRDPVTDEVVRCYVTVSPLTTEQGGGLLVTPAVPKQAPTQRAP